MDVYLFCVLYCDVALCFVKTSKISCSKENFIKKFRKKKTYLVLSTVVLKITVVDLLTSDKVWHFEKEKNFWCKSML